MQTTHSDFFPSPCIAIKGATLTAPKMPVPDTIPPKEASVEDWNKQFTHLHFLADLRSTLIKSIQSPGLAILENLIKMQIDSFKCWYFERRSSVVDDVVGRLIRYSTRFNDLFVDKNGKVLQDMGLDTILASIFKSLERDLKEYKPDDTNRLVFKQGIEGHRNWIKRLPSSCPKAKKALSKLFNYIDNESKLQVYLSFPFGIDSLS